MKKTVSTILVACMMMLFMAPSLAENDACWYMLPILTCSCQHEV